MSLAVRRVHLVAPVRRAAARRPVRRRQVVQAQNPVAVRLLAVCRRAAVQCRQVRVVLRFSL